MTDAARNETLVVDRGAEVDPPRALALAGGEALAFVQRSPHKPEGAGEDALALLPVGPDAAVLAVADGLGGHAQGATASSLVVRSLEAALARTAAEPSSVRAALLDATEAAHREILALATGAGATLAAVSLGPWGIAPVHAGDSAVLVVSQRGRIRLQTVAHSPTGYALESGMIDEDEALVHDDRHLISNFVGCEGMHLQVGEQLELRPRDTVLVASDGLLDNFSTDELVEHVRAGPLARAARTLADEVRERMLGRRSEVPGKPDDVSFVLFRRTGRRRTATPGR